MKIILAALITIISLVTNTAHACECSHITKKQVRAAQQKWAAGIVAIGKAADQKAVAEKHLDTLYAYDLGEVLFKPTKAAQKQFRATKNDALSYFVTGHIKEDKGFALAPFTKVKFKNEQIIIDCDSALAMGNYYFTSNTGEIIKVEYSFGYIKNNAGKLKINLHHSSLPYQGK